MKEKERDRDRVRGTRERESKKERQENHSKYPQLKIPKDPIVIRTNELKSCLMVPSLTKKVITLKYFYYTSMVHQPYIG